VHRVTAARWLDGARDAFSAAARRALAARLAVDTAEIDGILGAVESQLDVSLRALLRTVPAGER
jgi:hypothetical protein